jgi:hypothetical protein
LRYQRSYRDLEDIFGELGFEVDHGHAPVSAGWWWRSAPARSAVAAREVSHLPATAAIGNGSSGGAASLTVLIDKEAVYAPLQGNDRLLFSLKVASTNMSSTCSAAGSYGPAFCFIFASLDHS